jgi:hypothetical protein
MFTVPATMITAYVLEIVSAIAAMTFTRTSSDICESTLLFEPANAAWISPAEKPSLSIARLPS